MGITESARANWFEQYLQSTTCVIEQKQVFDYYPELVGAAFLVRKSTRESEA